MSDRDLSPEELARLRVQQVIEDELSRAGVELPPEQIQQIAGDFLAGEQSQGTLQMMGLLELGQGRGVTPENQGVSLDHARNPNIFPELFGQSPEDLWKKQREGWDGYGWTDDKIRAFGRNPQPRELSRGGRWANNWEANRNLLAGLLEQHKAIETERAQVDMGQLPEQARTRVLHRLIGDHDRTRKQTHGESGFLGAVANPEYAAGWAFGKMGNFGEAAHMQALDVEQSDTQYPEYELAESPLSAIGTAAMRYINHYYPKAESQRSVYGMSRAVEPTLPVGAEPAEGNREIAEAAERRNPNLDELVRMETGEYPSYGASGVATFLNGLLDPSIAAAGPAARATHMIGRGLSGAGKALGKGTLGGNFLRRWGSNLMRDANWSRQFPYAAAAMREASDEVPFGAGIQSAAAAANPQTPHVGKWMSPGNEARTDMYIYDQELHQAQPETNGMRPETQREFMSRMDELMRRSQGMMNKNFDLESRVKQSLIPEPVRPELPRNFGSMGAGAH